MNKKGFTLIELLAVLVLLGIILGLTIVIVNTGFNKTKESTEDIFIKTIKDSLDIYLDTSVSELPFEETNISARCLGKAGYSDNDKMYEVKNLSFKNVLDSKYSTLTLNDLVNPANKGNDNYRCFQNNNFGTLKIYRDKEFVYYYVIDKEDFGCLTTSDKNGKEYTGYKKYITNLPASCVELFK